MFCLHNLYFLYPQESFDFQQQAIPSIFAAYQHQPEHTYYTEEEQEADQSKEEIFGELKAWKEEHEKWVDITILGPTCTFQLGITLLLSAYVIYCF